MRIVVGALAALLITGCDDEPTYAPDVEIVDGVEIARLSEVPAHDEPALRWTFETLKVVPTQRTLDEEPSVYSPRTAVELSNGELFLHDDVTEGRLVILDPETGAVRVRFGRFGRGPGEIGGWAHLSEAEDGTLEVLDARNRQRHRFDLDGRWLGSVAADFEGVGGKLLAHPSGAGFLLDSFVPREGAWERVLMQWDDAGDVRPLFTLPLPSPDAEPGRIQQGRVLWTQVGSEIVSMWSSRPEFFVHDLEGRRLREVHLPWERRRIEESDIQRQVEAYGGIASRLRVGPAALTNEFFPASDTVFGMYQSDMWRPDGEPTIPVPGAIWRLFSTSGVYLGALPLPEDFWPLGRSGDRLWVRMADERGIPELREVRIVPDPG